MISIKDFGLQFEPQQGMTMQTLVDWSKYAEKKGYGYVFRSDHVIPTSPLTKRVESPECWTSIGAIAASTSKVKLGTMVSPIGYRNPTLLAKMSNTINSYSGGRLMLGVGAGWYEQEYLTYGYQFPDKTTRREEFAEALEIIKPMTNGKDVHFKGKFFSAEAEAAASVKKTHMIIGGRHPTTVKLAAKYADELNIYGPTPDEVARFRSILDTAVPKNKVQISLTVPLVIAENRRSLIAGMKAFRTSNGKTGDTEKAIEEAKKDGMLCGTPEEVSTAIRARYDAGISRFYLQVGDLRTTAMADLLTQTLKDL